MKTNLPNQNIKSYILDASAIFNGILAQDLHDNKYVSECVVSEIQGMLRGESFLEEISIRNDVIQLSPTRKSIKEINTIANKTGDSSELSPCDCELLALAYELKKKGENVVIITDDYDIQNLAGHLKIAYRGIYWKGITHIHNYYWECIGCGLKSKKKLDICLECGSEFKRKTIRKKK